LSPARSGRCASSSRSCSPPGIDERDNFCPRASAADWTFHCANSLGFAALRSRRKIGKGVIQRTRAERRERLQSPPAPPTAELQLSSRRLHGRSGRRAVFRCEQTELSQRRAEQCRRRSARDPGTASKDPTVSRAANAGSNRVRLSPAGTKEK